MAEHPFSENQLGLPGSSMPDIKKFSFGQPTSLVGSEMEKVDEFRFQDQNEQPQAIDTRLNLGNDPDHNRRIGNEAKMSMFPDDDMRFNRNRMDEISNPELLRLIVAKEPEDVRAATRDFVETIIETDRESFGADYKYETQTFLKVAKGLEKLAREKRKPGMEKEFRRCAQEIAVISQLLYWMNTFNAVGKSMGELGSRFDTMSTGTLMYPEAFQAIFNLPSTEMGNNKELGQRIDKVVRACMVVGMCEDPRKLEEMKSKPGWELLFSSEEEEMEFLGDFNEWDPIRTVKTNSITKQVEYDSLKREKASGLRVGIAKFGNLWARAENTEEAAEFRRSLLELVDNDELALHLGMGIFKIWGLDAEYGAMVINKDGKETAQLEGWPNASDLAKLAHFYIWQMKQNAAGHPCGPRETRGMIKKLFTSFPKFAVMEMPDGTKRTLYEEMWGTRNVPAKRLGDCSWNRLAPDVQNDWGTRINVPSGGKEGNGIFGWLKAEKSDPEAMSSDSFWEMFKLNLNVVVNEQLVADGELAGKDAKVLSAQVDALKNEIIQIYWQGVKSLPDYKYVWSGKYVDAFDQGFIRSLFGISKKVLVKDLVIAAAGRSGFTLN